MAEDYGIAPLPLSEQTNPDSLKRQLMQILALVQEDHEPWLRNEAEMLGSDNLAAASNLLDRVPSRRLVKLFQQLNPNLPLAALHQQDPKTVATGLLSVCPLIAGSPPSLIE